MDKKVIYRVILKVSYHSAWFEFSDAAEACTFATKALEHMVTSEDQDKVPYVSLQVVDPEEEKKAED